MHIDFRVTTNYRREKVGEDFTIRLVDRLKAAHFSLVSFDKGLEIPTVYASALKPTIPGFFA